MIPISSGARVWLVTGHTDMRKGFDGLALIVQEKELQVHLDASRKQIVDYFVPLVVKDPPDAMRGQFLKFDIAEARKWLDSELGQIFPEAGALIQNMQLEVRYKDVTFETLNREDFLEAVKAAFAEIDWEKAYEEFRAAGEKEG